LPDISSGGLCPPDAHNWYPKIELDQLERKPRETNWKMFGLVHRYMNGYCQMFLVVGCARQTLLNAQIELD